MADIRLAVEALHNVNAPFRLATCGWVLGPKHNRAAFDREVPKDLPMSALSQDLGAVVVDPAFARIAGREKWAIPWMESDARQGLAGLQLWAGRMRRDAVDARQYGCTGLMGLHWRTEIISPNVSALAQAAWEQSWRKDGLADAGMSRYLPVDDFYADWAKANFGLPEASKVFAAIDGKVPQVTDGGCPSGNLSPVGTPWAQVVPQFAFVDEFEKLRPRVKGAGNLDRFDYWLNTFKHLRALMRVRCAIGAKQPDEVFKAWAEAYTCLLATVNSPGALAMVVNMENHPGWAATVAGHTPHPWPKTYQGRPRLIVPTVRSVLNEGELLKLKIIAIDKEPMQSVAVRLRPLGKDDWRTIPAAHIARAVYEARLPAAEDDFEYYVSAATAGGKTVLWPAAAPRLNQTVVTMPANP